MNMKTIFTLLVAFSLHILPLNSKPSTLNSQLISPLGESEGAYPINPVPFTSVKVTPNTFWGQRL